MEKERLKKKKLKFSRRILNHPFRKIVAGLFAALWVRIVIAAIFMPTFGGMLFWGIIAMIELCTSGVIDNWMLKIGVYGPPIA